MQFMLFFENYQFKVIIPYIFGKWHNSGLNWRVTFRNESLISANITLKPWWGPEVSLSLEARFELYVKSVTDVGGLHLIEGCQ